MNGKLAYLVGTLALLGLPLGSAQAGWRIGIGIGFPVFYRPAPAYRVYVAPAPVYVTPAPVYYAQPTQVYVPPAPVAQPAYQGPAPAPAGYLPPQPVPVR
jgi:hypothetical protein